MAYGKMPTREPDIKYKVWWFYFSEGLQFNTENTAWFEFHLEKDCVMWSDLKSKTKFMYEDIHRDNIYKAVLDYLDNQFHNQVSEVLGGLAN